MSQRSIRLLASAAASAGLALAGLTATAPAAEAATSSATAMYTCTPPATLPIPIPGLPTSFQVPATFSVETVDDALLANVPVPAGTPIVGQLDLSQAGLLPSTLIALQGAVNLVVGHVPGSGPIAGPLNGAFTQIAGNVATVTAQLPAFTPSAGPLPVPVPTEFQFASVLPGLSALGIRCTLNPGSAQQRQGGVPVLTQRYGAMVKASAVNRPERKAVVKVKVKTSAGQKAVGSVKAAIKGMETKTKTLRNGKTTVAFGNLTMGKHTIKLRFLGNGFTNPAAKRVSVRIVR